MENKLEQKINMMSREEVIHGLSHVFQQVSLNVLKGLLKAFKRDKNDTQGVLASFFINNQRCESHCPKCGAEENNIEWGISEFNTEVIVQPANCNKCGCEFNEYSIYQGTEIEE